MVMLYIQHLATAVIGKSPILSSAVALRVTYGSAFVVNGNSLLTYSLDGAQPHFISSRTLGSVADCAMGSEYVWWADSNGTTRALRLSKPDSKLVIGNLPRASAIGCSSTGASCVTADDVGNLTLLSIGERPVAIASSDSGLVTSLSVSADGSFCTAYSVRRWTVYDIKKRRIVAVCNRELSLNYTYWDEAAGRFVGCGRNQFFSISPADDWQIHSIGKISGIQGDVLMAVSPRKAKFGPVTVTCTPGGTSANGAIARPKFRINWVSRKGSKQTEACSSILFDTALRESILVFIDSQFHLRTVSLK